MVLLLCVSAAVWELLLLLKNNRNIVTKKGQSVWLLFLHIPNSCMTTAFYSPDVIISVGYGVKSKRGAEFRKWANRVLKDYIMKGLRSVIIVSISLER
ncbi:hypothetical protein D1151_06125 [Emergencia sp. 1XD21-10]|jgi:hypothetical protein|nr:hypothetical protein [Emergencia sp. 1XD21-10]